MRRGELYRCCCRVDGRVEEGGERWCCEPGSEERSDFMIREGGRVTQPVDWYCNIVVARESYLCYGLEHAPRHVVASRQSKCCFLVSKI